MPWESDQSWWLIPHKSWCIPSSGSFRSILPVFEYQANCKFNLRAQLVCCSHGWAKPTQVIVHSHDVYQVLTIGFCKCQPILGHLMSEGKWWRFMAKAAWLRFWVTAASNLAAPKQSRYQMSFTSICKFKQLGSGNSAIHYTGWFKATPTLDDSNPKWNQLVWHVSLSMCGLPQTIPKNDSCWCHQFWSILGF